ncbi:glycosyltransferase family 2 protein [Roseibium sp. RKSG952]|uniref:glycosyltransferase family 2 protein n=1 Tax=Roseibium sp. RKSG952 TaxID=2529384 RepID=UPI0012BC3DA0|nr:glycosyltransferase family 2 protein [Roseibium sp. RKSG952]MTH99598.1 hypothetical protein [Roseibium sp. RKSG952]
MMLQDMIAAGGSTVRDPGVSQSFLKGTHSHLGSFDVEVVMPAKTRHLRTQTLAEGEVLQKDPALGDTSVLVCATMYNEPVDLFLQTLEGMAASIGHLRASNDGAQPNNIVLVFLVDGADKLHPSTREEMQRRGLLPRMEGPYPDDGGMTVHESVLLPVGPEGNARVMVAMKHMNGGKLDSHRWVLRSIAPGLNPMCWLQIDTGNVPSLATLSEISRLFAEDPSVAAVVPRVEVEPRGSNLNPLYLFQHVDFLWSRLLRLPAMDVMGYVDIVPGQMSATRWEWFNRDSGDGKTVADRYLEGLHATKPHDIVRFLTEDALIGFELMCAEGSDLRVVTSYRAMSQVEPCDTLPALLKQRRRWMNGGAVSTLYQAVNLKRYWKASNSGWFRKSRVCAVALWTAFTMLLALAFTPAAILGLVSLDASLVTALPAAAVAPYLLLVGIAAVCLVLPAVIAATPYLSRLTQQQTGIMLSAAGISTLLLFGISAIKIGLAAAFTIILPLTLVFLAVGAILGRRTLRVVLRSVWSLVFVMLPMGLMIQVYAVFNLHDATWGTKGISKLHASKADVDPASVTRGLRRFRNAVLAGFVAVAGLLALSFLEVPAFVLPVIGGVIALQILAYLPAVLKALTVRFGPVTDWFARVRAHRTVKEVFALRDRLGAGFAFRAPDDQGAAA